MEPNLEDRTMRIHPDFNDRLDTCPIRGLVAEAIGHLDTPRRVGYEATATTTAVKHKGKDAVATLSRVIVDELLAGASVERVRGIARALDLGIRRMAGTLPRYTDLVQLLKRETAAQCRADPRQQEAMRPETMTDAELEQLRDDLYAHSEASAEAAVGVEVYLLQRAEPRATARGRLAA
jgi:hypothetical protein